MAKKHYPKRIKDETVEETNLFGFVTGTKTKPGLEIAHEIYDYVDKDTAYYDMINICKHDALDPTDEDKLKADAIKTILLYDKDPLGVRLWIMNGIIGVSYIKESLELMFPDSDYYSYGVIGDMLTLATRSNVRYQVIGNDKLTREELKDFINFFDGKEQLTDNDYLRLEKLSVGKVVNHRQGNNSYGNNSEVEALKQEMADLKKQFTANKGELDLLVEVEKLRQEKEVARLAVLRAEGMAFLLSHDGIDEELIETLERLGQIDVGDIETLKKFVHRLEKQSLDLGFSLGQLGAAAELELAAAKVDRDLDAEEQANIIRKFIWETIDRYPELEGTMQEIVNRRFQKRFRFVVRKTHSLTIGMGPRKGEKVPRRGNIAIFLKDQRGQEQQLFN